MFLNKETRYYSEKKRAGNNGSKKLLPQHQVNPPAPTNKLFKHKGF